MPPAKKRKAHQSSANALSAPLQTASGNSSTAKRKRTDANNTATGGGENENEDNQAQKQPRQDDSPDPSDSFNDTASSREILFGIPWLLFQSPFEGDMCLEVVAPSVKYKHGCVRLHGPRGHWNMDAVFSLPFATIENIIIMRNRKRSAEKKNAYEVLIVPTNATGLAPISHTQTHAQIITFNLPDQKIDTQVYGTMTSGADKNTLILSLLKNALNERLAEFNKTVTDLSQEGKAAGSPLRIPTTLEPVMTTNLEKKVKGLLQLLDGWVLFRSEAVTLCIPTSQLINIRLVFAKDVKLGIIGMELVLSVSHPVEDTASPDKPGGRACALLSFHGLSWTLGEFISRFAEKSNIKVLLNLQHFYSYTKNQPMSGWSDLPPDLKRELFGNRIFITSGSGL
ncbi:hypothetical protein O1611_g3048 [Lasiodiplodia mahajangana]|uniref:Uncharacterized protein n=1 Tax=Lasiodiplodia mahajangana TaxID=1108764 RepID=A0ACC2JSV3_9PEZI|nr:hypothetical protein O1611_g3048 [Lasiodiplodia mahajangana]